MVTENLNINNSSEEYEVKAEEMSDIADIQSICIDGLNKILLSKDKDCAIGLIQEYDRTGTYLRNPDYYKPFDRTSDGLFIKGCIEPRRDTDPDMKNSIMQSPGGAPGEAIDTILSLYGKDLVNGKCRDTIETLIRDALIYKRDSLQPNIVFDAHDAVGCVAEQSGCAYIDNMGSILSVIAAPDEYSLRLVNGLCKQYKINPKSSEFISDAADALLIRSNFVMPSPLRIIDIAKESSPDYPNIRTVDGEKGAQYYIVNRHPKLGFARRDFHDAQPIVRTYADSLGASIRKIHSAGHLNNHEKDLKITARIWRTVATAQILAQSMDYPLRFIEIIPNKGCGKVVPVFARDEHDIVRI